MSPPKQWSATSLSTFDRNCPQALEFYMQRKHDAQAMIEKEYEVEGPEMAEIGISFHACIHAAADARKKDQSPWDAIEATAVALSTKMHPGRARAGADMAIDFAKWWEFPNLDFEHGVAFDPHWRQVEWDNPARRVRLIFDACGVETVEDENYGEIKIARGQDYKTGWGVTKDEIDSIQMDLYATALRKMYPEVDGIKLEIIATRFTRVYSKLFIFGEEEHDAELRKRKANVEYWMNAGDASDGKPRLGPGCLRCNYTNRCEVFQDRAKSVLAMKDLARNPEEVARDYAVVTARAKEMETFLETAAAIKPIELDGRELGYHASEKREVKDYTAPLKIWMQANGMTLTEDIESVLNGLFAVMEPGVTQVDKVIKKTASTFGYKTQKAAIEGEGGKHYNTLKSLTWGWKKRVERKGTEK